MLVKTISEDETNIDENTTALTIITLDVLLCEILVNYTGQNIGNTRQLYFDCLTINSIFKLLL